MKKNICDVCGKEVKDFIGRCMPTDLFDKILPKKDICYDCYTKATDIYYEEKCAFEDRAKTRIQAMIAEGK